MGVPPGVALVGRDPPSKDAEVALRYVTLNSKESWRRPPSATASFFIFGFGRGRVEGQAVEPGRLLVGPASTGVAIEAEKQGLNFFEVQIPNLESPVERVEVRPRVPLSIFHAEQIVVPGGTPFRFGSTFNLAEVIVPQGVTTSEHDLGVNERYLMLGGPATMFLDDRSYLVNAGSVVHIPSGTVQSIRNDSTQPLRFYCLCTPPFTPDTFAPGQRHGSGPAGFDIDSWWQLHAPAFT